MNKITAKNIHQSKTDKLEVFLFNVGQGDHLMLKFPTNEYGIIDFFYNSEITSEPPCLSYFKKLKQEINNADEFKKITIAFFCISHTDKDHIKGVSKTLKWLLDNGVFIKNFWFCAAKDESDYKNLFDTKIRSALKTLEFYSHIKYDKQIKLFNTELVSLFANFNKWKNRKIESTRYKNEHEKLGHGQYLFDIKALMNPSKNSKAINIGPLYNHLLNFNKTNDLDFLYKVIGVLDKKETIDKNDVSHILNIKFGKTNIIFGGDTHKEVWEECIKEYMNSDYNHLNSFGDIKSHFIKVSHHGSKNSSSKKVLEEITAKRGEVYFGISAGQHNSYKHPHEETLSDIKAVKKESIIFSTNICGKCLKDNDNKEEYHQWYDDLTSVNFNYGKNNANEYDTDIKRMVKLNSVSQEQIENNEDLGLFAYIFEIPNDPKEKINIRLAFSKRNKINDCFFKNHKSKLTINCE